MSYNSKFLPALALAAALAPFAANARSNPAPVQVPGQAQILVSANGAAQSGAAYAGRASQANYHGGAAFIESAPEYAGLAAQNSTNNE